MMVTVAIFGFGVLVALMCSGAVGLLLWGAYQDGKAPEFAQRKEANAVGRKTHRIGAPERISRTSAVLPHPGGVS